MEWVAMGGYSTVHVVFGSWFGALLDGVGRKLFSGLPNLTWYHHN